MALNLLKDTGVPIEQQKVYLERFSSETDQQIK